MATTIERETQQHHDPRGPALVPPDADKPTTPGKGRRIITLAGLGVLLLGLAGLGAKKFIWSRSHVSTDDAQVDGDILPILPKVGGFVASVRVQDNQPVRAGDTLIVIDDRDFRARLQQAEANLAIALANAGSDRRTGQADAAVQQADARASKAHADLDRLTPLAARGIVSSQQLDAAQAAARSADAALAAARAALRGADAHVAAARAQREQAALELSYTRILAPSAGIVSKKDVEVGQLVQPGQPLMSVVPVQDVWITANLKETQVQDVRPGEPVAFSVDAYPGRQFRGHVESLAAATGARFSLLPPDNATGNFTKVVQRLPVRIAPGEDDPEHPLRPGMSVVVTIRTR
jgi:membrane fusion protein (multidrug efflux system)